MFGKSNLLFFSFHVCKIWRLRLAKQIAEESMEAREREIGVWCECEVRKDVHKKALKWLHMRAKFFSYLRQRLSSLPSRHVVGETSKNLVNRERKEGARKSANTLAAGAWRAHWKSDTSQFFPYLFILYFSILELRYRSLHMHRKNVI